MWVFLTDAFFSIVEDRDNPTILMVRARLPGDIEAHFGDSEVVEMDAADYRFRAFVPRDEVRKVIADQVDAIDYPDFKSQIDLCDDVRNNAYHHVWAEMRAAQHDRLTF